MFYGSLGMVKPMLRLCTDKRRRTTHSSAAAWINRDHRTQTRVGSWRDLGIFIQNVVLGAAGRGLQSRPQETFAKYHRVLRPPLSIPAEQIVACGLSIGHAKTEVKDRLMPRANMDAFATFVGFDE